MFCFSDEAHFLLSGHANSKNLFSAAQHHPKMFFSTHYTRWNVLSGWPSQSMASMDLCGLKTKMKGPSQSTENVISRKFWKTLRRRVRVIRAEQWFRWPSCDNAFQIDWSADMTPSGPHTHLTLTPKISICGAIWKNMSMRTTPRQSETLRQK